MNIPREPFVIVPEWLLDVDLSASAVGVYCAMKSYLNRESGLCNPSLTTIAARAGMSHDSVQRYVESLEKVRAVRIVHVSGRHNRYEFPEADTTRKDACGEGNNSANHTQDHTQDHTQHHTHWCVSNQKNQKNAEEAAKAAAAVSQEQMEKEVLGAWNYYLEASGSEEILSPSKKKMGLAIIRKMHECGVSHPVQDVACVIDMAKHIAKKNPKKAGLFRWTSIFWKWNTFASLHQEYRETPNVLEGAELPADLQTEANATQ